MTRTLFFGQASSEQKIAYRTVFQAQKKVINYLKVKNKTSGNELDKIARDFVKSQGYPDIPHSLGHGVGINIHESPKLSPISKEKITKGMIFSLEPGIYLPGKFGIRIEDLVFLGKKPEIITHSPRTLIEL